MLKAPKRTPYLRKPRAGGLVERLDLAGDSVAAQHAERLDHAEGEAAGEAGEVRRFAQRDERREPAVELGGKPSLDAAQHLLALGRPEMLIGKAAGSWA